MMTTTLMALLGCGSSDLGKVTGRVVQDGVARGFQAPESLNILFSSISNETPMSYSASVLPDGTFYADRNDGTGRGIPEGEYLVTIDVNSLLIQDPKAKPLQASASIESPDVMYPQPSPDLKKRLSQASCTVEVHPRTSAQLIVDLGKGTISTQSGSN